MSRFIARRLVVSLAMLFAASVLLFLLLRAIPGDPTITRLGTNSNASPHAVAVVRSELGLDKSIPQQYVEWIGGMFHGDFGRSYFSQFDVSTLISQRLGPTLELSLVTVLLDLLIAVPVAVVVSLRPGGFLDRVVGLGASLGMSFPPFVAGILLLLLFAVQLGWFPTSGFVSIATDPLENLRSIALPVATLVIVTVAPLMRYLRSQLIEELQSHYVRTAVSKGSGRSRVVLRHALPNALVPGLTMLGLIAGYTIGGVVIVEYVFGINGLGSLAIESATKRDYGVLQSVVLLLASAFIITSFLVDVVSAWLDPRIRLRLTANE
jgi:peptide/nickel transport system permease protein